MDEDLFDLAKENDLDFSEAEEVQDIADDNGIDLDDAYEIWESL